MFEKIIAAIDRSGWLIITLGLFTTLIVYGVKHDIMSDVIFGSVMVGGVFTKIFDKISDYVDSHKKDSED